MNDQGVYQSSLVAVDFALSMRSDEHFETFVLSRILLEPYQSSNDERMTLYRIMQDNYGQGLKMFKNHCLLQSNMVVRISLKESLILS